MNEEHCGGCEEQKILTPTTIINQPGLHTLVYRVGTHASFFETMKARLSSSEFPSLASLKARDYHDPSIALLDAWATVADILTFYQERIANEGYLRTAKECRSILELASLVYYTPGPGVSVSVFLALTIEDGYNTEIPTGTRVESLPSSGGMPQPFETFEPLAARADLNTLKPRTTEPQRITLSPPRTTSPPGTTPPTPPPGTTPPTPPPGTTPPTPPPETTPPVQPPGTTPPVQPPGTTPPVQPPGTTPPTPPPETTPPVQPPETTPPVQPPETTPPAQPPETTPPAQPPETTPPVQPPGTTPPAQPPETTPPAQSPETTPPAQPPETTPPVQPPETTPPVQPPGTTPPVQPPETTPPVQPPGTTPPAQPSGTTPPTLPSGTTPPTQPPIGSVDPTDATQIDKVYLKGIATNLASGDGLLFVFGNAQAQQVFRQVQSVKIQPTLERTLIILQPNSPASNSLGSILSTQNPSQIPEQIQLLLQPPSQQPANASQLQRPPSQALNPNFDAIDARIMGTLAPGLSTPGILGNILTNLQDNANGNLTNSSAQPPTVRPSIYAMRVKSAPFGHNAPLRPIYDDGKPGQIKNYEEWLITGKDKPANVALNEDTTSAASGLANPVSLILPSSASSLANLVSPIPPPSVSSLLEPLLHAKPNLLPLDTQYNQIIPGSWVVIKRLDKPQIICRITKVEDVSQAKYRMTGRVTQLTLEQPWLTGADTQLTVFRNTTVYAESELLDLEEMPIDEQNQNIASGSNNEQNPLGGSNNEDSPGGGENEQNPAAGGNNGENDPNTPQGSSLNASSQEIELDSLHTGLTPGRWVIISGERSDVPNMSGIMASEAVMLAGVKHGVRQVPSSGNIPSQTPPNSGTSQTPPNGGGFQNLPGEKPHTFLQLAKPLTYSYKPDTVTIYGNVVKATHGETCTEILGSGDASQEFQQFTLSQSPLTYLPTPTPTGAASTLKVFVNDVPWQEIKSLAQAGPLDHSFITQTDENGNTTIIFGNGHNGARLPSGVENVRAVYRAGVGKKGNVEAGQISQLVAPPLGLRGVFNPLPETGGTNRESCELVRRNAPLGMMSLNRAVSVQDYADFARTTAWIGKASAVQLCDRHRQIIHLTIASVEDIPIDKNADSYRNFLKVLYQFADPHLTIQVDRRELMLLIVSAKVRILPSDHWESVTSNIKAALSNTFSFENRELGQDVFLSEVISTIQQVSGVDYVDVDILDSVSETEVRNPIILRQKLKDLAMGTQVGEKQPQQPKERIIVNLANINSMASGQSRIQPAQLAILSPQVHGTLILQELLS